jgi:hypothetical protein
MKPTIKITILLFFYVLNLFSQEDKIEIAFSKTSKLIKPALFGDFGENSQIINRMTLDKKENLYLTITKKVSLEGTVFGPDGNIYLMDNQFFTRDKNFSRLIRVIVRNGTPVETEVLVEGFNCGGLIRWSENRIYVTDAIFENRIESGIYSFSLEELNKKDIVLNSSNKKFYLTSTFVLEP